MLGILWINSMTKATENENTFKDYFESKFGKGSLGGKKNYKEEDKNVRISVDQSLDIDGRTVLIEIDSGNMAKLLVGQYVLINEISGLTLKNSIFVVVHFYKNYKPERTKKNLDLVFNNIYKKNAIPHCALTFEEFKDVCKNSQNLVDLEIALKAKCSTN